MAHNRLQKTYLKETEKSDYEKDKAFLSIYLAGRKERRAKRVLW